MIYTSPTIENMLIMYANDHAPTVFSGEDN